jgi:hypothetical protein
MLLLDITRTLHHLLVARHTWVLQVLRLVPITNLLSRYEPHPLSVQEPPQSEQITHFLPVYGFIYQDLQDLNPNVSP